MYAVIRTLSLIDVDIFSTLQFPIFVRTLVIEHLFRLIGNIYFR